LIPFTSAPCFAPPMPELSSIQVDLNSTLQV
jgi:hypothetical protein